MSLFAQLGLDSLSPDAFLHPPGFAKVTTSAPQHLDRPPSASASATTPHVGHNTSFAGGLSKVTVLDSPPPISEAGGVPVGSAEISAHVPPGCGCAKDMVKEIAHHPVEYHVADMAGALYQTRMAADDLTMFTKEPEIKDLSQRMGVYAHDLEFLSRQLGLALDMPISVTPPFLPLDIQMPKADE